MYEGDVLAFIEADTGLWSTPSPVLGPLEDRRLRAAEDDRPAFAQWVPFRGRFSAQPVIILAPVSVDFAGSRLEYFLRPERVSCDGFQLSLYVDGLPDAGSHLGLSVQWVAIRPELFR